jgi:hypothetical protein
MQYDWEVACNVHDKGGKTGISTEFCARGKQYDEIVMTLEGRFREEGRIRNMQCQVAFGTN